MADEVRLLTERGDKKAKTPWFRDVSNNLANDFSKRRFVQKWDFAHVDIRLRCTNKCNENCRHCFECSGPSQPLKYIPVKDASFYLNSVPKKFDSVYITGGEWSLVYDAEPRYMLKIFDAFDTSKTDVYCIQTNCRWVFGENRNQIFSDLLKIQNALSKSGKVLRLSTSVDSYHSAHIVDCVKELIRTIASNKKFNATKIVIMSSRSDAGMVQEKVMQPEFFKKHGIKLKIEPKSIFTPYFQVCYANDVRVVVHEENPVMRIGRACKNNFGYKIFYPSLQCKGLTDESLCFELSLQEDGMMKWHSFYDWNIMTPYKDENGNNKPMSQIKNELIEKAWRKLLRENMKEFAWSCIPLYGMWRRLKKYKEIKSSFEENSKKVVFQLESVKDFSK